MQRLVVAQMMTESGSRPAKPTESRSGCQLRPSSLLSASPDGPPTAKQRVMLGHESAPRLPGGPLDRATQDSPPSELRRSRRRPGRPRCSALAKQTVAVGHDSPANQSGAGALARRHELPASLLRRRASGGAARASRPVPTSADGTEGETGVAIARQLRALGQVSSSGVRPPRPWSCESLQLRPPSRLEASHPSGPSAMHRIGVAQDTAEKTSGPRSRTPKEDLLKRVDPDERVAGGVGLESSPGRDGGRPTARLAPSPATPATTAAKAMAMLRRTSASSRARARSSIAVR